ncbi:MAG: deoxyribodipyrimidine photo-lyase [Phycisphaerae bacterium]|nr:deoxyribodipyrimidine photo-lyase [Phycisphaerae bacterium]
MPPNLVWFRQDLRLEDNEALLAAVECGAPVIPVFINTLAHDGQWAPGAASRWWLHHSLAALDKRLRQRGSRLVLRRGPAADTLIRLVRETGASAVIVNRHIEPDDAQTDAELATRLQRLGTQWLSFQSNLLFDPDAVRTRQGRAFTVFTPFWRACLSQDEPPAPRPAPARIPKPRQWPTSLPLNELEPLPEIDWAGGLRTAWTPGEAGAQRLLTEFADRRWRSYDRDRERPDLPGTSRLSPHLHWGEIGPRQIWHALHARAARSRAADARDNAAAYLRQLGWREFAHGLLHHFPQTTDKPMREAFARFPWRKDTAALRTWQQGQTGYPLVDAGMRELWRTGWMHNRVRMIAASFLTKHLLIPWQQGAAWFWDTLVDADLANNTLGWQWVAGCGADAAPYFRIFNPASQGETNDPNGNYVRRWVPELAELPAKWIHRPWKADAATLAAAGVKLGHTYPRPIVDHALARERALAAYQTIRKRNAPS